jgi:hypothetical protein
MCNYTQSKVLQILNEVYSNQLNSLKKDNWLTQHMLILKEENIDADKLELHIIKYFSQKYGILTAQIWSKLRTHIAFMGSPNIASDIFSQLLVVWAPLITRVEITMKDSSKLTKVFQIQLWWNLNETGLEKVNFFLSEIDDFISWERQKLKEIIYYHEVRGYN